MEGSRIILGFIISIVSAIYCSNRAKYLNRNQFWWAVFGFLMPLFAIIWISIAKENNSSNPQQNNQINLNNNFNNNFSNSNFNSSISKKGGYNSGDLYK